MGSGERINKNKPISSLQLHKHQKICNYQMWFGNDGQETCGHISAGTESRAERVWLLLCGSRQWQKYNYMGQVDILIKRQVTDGF